MKKRFALPVIALALAACLPGCGGGSQTGVTTGPAVQDLPDEVRETEARLQKAQDDAAAKQAAKNAKNAKKAQ